MFANRLISVLQKHQHDQQQILFSPAFLTKPRFFQQIKEDALIKCRALMAEFSQHETEQIFRCFKIIAQKAFLADSPKMQRGEWKFTNKITAQLVNKMLGVCLSTVITSGNIFQCICFQFSISSLFILCSTVTVGREIVGNHIYLAARGDCRELIYTVLSLVLDVYFLFSLNYSQLG